MSKKNIVIAISFIISLIFIYAAVMKIMDYKLFTSDLRKSPLLANYNMSILAPSILGVEMVAAILLNIDTTRKLGLYLSFFIMLSFTLYLVTLYYFYKNIPCACGGILGKISYPVHIWFNIAVTLLAAWGLLLNNSRSVQKAAVS